MTRPRAHPFPPKLGYEDAERIRERYGNGESARALAREYEISVSCLYDVIRRKSYAGRVVVVLTGQIMTMPGLPVTPAANGIEVGPDGRISGLF